VNRRLILVTGALISAFPAAAATHCSALPLQDSPSSQSQASPQKASEQESTAADASPAERKKTKKVWTNDNLGEVSGSAISQVGDVKNSSPANSSATKSASPQVVAAFRKQLAALQAQLSNIDKQIAGLKSFSKGEASGANGLQMHSRYSTEPVEDQVRKLEEKRRLLAAKMDAVFDAARKQGIEPGQLR
jgi:hypothetical protein